jgi:late competence protein required for DNA uptake (superfamily II DNA/RNA helicase)
LTALGQSEDLSKRNKILELTIDDLKYDNRNCVIMNRVLGDELKQTSDSLNFCRFKLLKLDSTVNVQSAKIQALQSSKSTLIWAVSILGVILLGIAFIWVRLIGHVKSV